MYIKSLEIENIRSIKKLAWEIKENDYPGWHVFLGENGTGKTTVLRSLCISITQKSKVNLLVQDWNNWLSKDHKKGSIKSIIKTDWHMDRITMGINSLMYVSIPDEFNSIEVEVDDYVKSERLLKFEGPKVLLSIGDINIEYDAHNALIKSYDYIDKLSGFLYLAYGAHRRLLGGEKIGYEESIKDRDVLSVITLFGNNYCLEDCVFWMQELKFREYSDSRNGIKSSISDLINGIIEFFKVNKFSPYGNEICDINPDGVFIKNIKDEVFSLYDLSEGVSSIMSLCIDIVKNISFRFEPEEIFKNINNGTINIPGIVLIDEIDAHLHPVWQKEIGFWLKKAFPDMQFIVTTHSPLVCQAAATGGSVYKLPAPGSNDEGRMLEGIELNRILYGDILDAYDTPAFGLPDTRSDLGEQFVHELALLNRKERRQILTQEEKTRQMELRSYFPTIANE